MMVVLGRRRWEEWWPILPVALAATVNETRLTHLRSAIRSLSSSREALLSERAD